MRLSSNLAWTILVFMGAGCGGGGGSPSPDSFPDASGPDGAPPDSASASQCGFVMPNPVVTGLPNPASYTTNSDGTVKDNVTGLTWEGVEAPSAMYGADATAYCTNKDGSWRLPSRLELISLVDPTSTSGELINQTYFPNVMAAGPFWTSTAYVGLSIDPSAWDVDFVDGLTGYAYVDYQRNRVRCVRTTTSRCFQTRYLIQAGLVVDQTTGLTWQQDASTADYGWNDAGSYCSAVGTGWRLPSLTELQTIVDDTTANPWIDETVFSNSNIADDTFWTSSALDANYAWLVSFSDGTPSHGSITNAFRARCVR
jgi:hypothetical protein